MDLLKYACLPFRTFKHKTFFCARDCLNSNVSVFTYLVIIWKRIFMHQTTSDNQQLKDSLKNLKGA